MRNLLRIGLVCVCLLTVHAHAATWVATSKPPGQSNQEEIISIASAGDGQIVYAVTKLIGGSNVLGSTPTTLWKSQDGGLTWATLSHRK